MARKLIVEIVGDSKSLERSFDRSSKAAKKFESTTVPVVGRVDSAFKSIQGVAAGAFVGGAAATAAIQGIRAVTNAASDLNEQISKNQQVFGDSAAAVQAWSETTAKSIGISETAALTAASTFGNLFSAMGTGPAQAAKLSTSLVKLAADLASFNNASPEDVLLAIQSGLVGEVEPLRRFGVQLSAARVQAVALADTGKTVASSLTDQEKAAARVKIIFQDTAKAQGDFARTSQGLANQQRILRAEVTDLEAKLGKLLLPAITELVSALSDATEGALVLADGLQKLGQIKIPEIHIPFVVDLGGQEVSGPIGDFAKNVAKGFIGALNPGLAIAIALGDAFKKDTEGATPELANSFARSINTMWQSALDTAATQVKPAKTPKGFGTGLTPKDLFGPILKDIPDALQEGLLDAQLSGSTGKTRAALVKERDRILDELDRPDLTRPDRIRLKKLLQSVKGSIESTDAEIAAGVKAANDKRQARLDKLAQDAKDAADRQRAGFDTLISLLQLQFDIADANGKFAKQKAASKALERAIIAQIQVEGRTPELLRDLFQQRQETADVIDKEQTAKQFRRLGLGPGGEDIIPGKANLQKQFASLSERLKGSGVKLGSKVAQEFKLAGKLLKDPLTKLKPEVATAIRDLFSTVRGEFDKGINSGDIVHVTPATVALNRNRILSGLGLDRETERILRSRLAGFTQAGRKLSPTPGTHGAFGIVVTPQPVTVHTTVNLDGQKVAKNTTVHQGKAKRSNPPQKRGWTGGWI